MVARLCATNLIFTIGVTQLESIFFYWMSDQFDYDVREVAYILVAMAVVMASVQGGGIRPLVQHLGEKRMLVGGLVLMAVAFPLIPGIHAVGLLMIPLALSALGRAIAQPPMSSMISMRGEASGRGELMGVFQSSAALARIFGPLIAGLLYDLWSPSPFFLAGTLFATGALLSLSLTLHMSLLYIMMLIPWSTLMGGAEEKRIEAHINQAPTEVHYISPEEEN